MTEVSFSTSFKEKLNFGTTLLASGSIFAIVGSFMAWMSLGVLSVSGFSGDGKITAVAGLIALIFIVFIYSPEPKRSAVTSLLCFLSGLATIFTVTYDGTNLSRVGSTGQLFSANTGIGIYVVFLGGVLMAMGSIATFANINKENFYRLGSLAKQDLLKVVIMTLIAILTIGGAYAVARSKNDAKSSVNQPSAAVSPAPENEPEEKPILKVISKSARKEEYGSGLKIMGEMQNIGNVNAYGPKISVTLFSKGQVVATSKYGETPSMIPKDMVVPYTSSISNAPAYDEIRVEVEASNKSYQDYQYLTVLSQNPRVDDHSGYYSTLAVAGEVQNNSNNDIGGSMGGSQLFAWLVDASNNVVAVQTTYLEGEIKAGQKKPYEVSFSFGETAPDYKTMKVIGLGSISRKSGTSTSGNTQSSTAPGEQTSSDQGSYTNQTAAEDFVKTQQSGPTPMTPIDPSTTWRDDATLHVIHATPKTGNTSRGDFYYFFVDGNYIDSKEFTAGTLSDSIDDATFSVTYSVYKPGDPHCCPSGGKSTVRFQWDGSKLVTLDSMQGAMMS